MQNKEQHLIAAIYELIEAGGQLTDAAETCGHDDELYNWNKTVKFIKKKFPIDPNVQKEYKLQRVKLAEEKRIKKEKVLEAQRLKEHEEIQQQIKESMANLK
jgi:hypothetical protein